MNPIIPAKDFVRELTDAWVDIVNKDRRTPLNRADAMALFWVAHGGILADTEEAHEAEVARLMEDK